MRIGTGFDIHPLIKGEKLILGGVEIDCLYGLQGHSDADVLTHALMDAILGALAKGDIGRHFPDSDKKYKDISSLVLLNKVRVMMENAGFKINNIDLTLFAQKPKLSPYYNLIVGSLCSQLGVEKERINLKATTTESLGFLGREEGMAAQAVVLLLSSE